MNTIIADAIAAEEVKPAVDVAAESGAIAGIDSDAVVGDCGGAAYYPKWRAPAFPKKIFASPRNPVLSCTATRIAKPA